MTRLTLTVETPLTVPDAREAGNLVRTNRWIPGTTLRGAFAAAWIARYGTPDGGTSRREEFHALFEGALRYPTLLPLGSSFEPISVLRCKYRAKPECDVAPIDRADLEDEAAPATCPACDGPLEPGKGRLLGADEVVRRATRTALDGDERASDGDLYTTESIRPGTVLASFFKGDTAQLEQFELLHIGRRRTVGGQVHVKWDPVSEPAPTPRSDGRIVIRLTAPAIVVDRWGAPSGDFDLEEIAALLGTDVAELGPTRSWARTGRTGGWHAASGLPKPDEMTLAAGSTLVLSPSMPVDSEALERLADVGLGVRRNEGFGSVELNPAPWTPPSRADATADGDTDTAATHSTKDLVDDLRTKLSTSDRRWLVSALRARRAHPERTIHPPHRRVDPLLPTTRAQLLRSLELRGGQLDEAITALSAAPEGGRR